MCSCDGRRGRDADGSTPANQRVPQGGLRSIRPASGTDEVEGTQGMAYAAGGQPFRGGGAAADGTALSGSRDPGGSSAPKPSVAGQRQPTGARRRIGTSTFRRDVQTTHDDMTLAFFSSNGNREPASCRYRRVLIGPVNPPGQ